MTADRGPIPQENQPRRERHLIRNSLVSVALLASAFGGGWIANDVYRGSPDTPEPSTTSVRIDSAQIGPVVELLNQVLSKNEEVNKSIDNNTDSITRLTNEVSSLGTKINEVSTAVTAAQTGTPDAGVKVTPTPDTGSKPNIAPSTQVPGAPAVPQAKPANSQELTLDQAIKVIDIADGKIDGRLTVKISKAEGAGHTDNLNWAGERVLEKIGAPHFNAGEPIENGGPSWRLINALIEDQGKTAEDFHWFNDGDEIQLEVKEKAAQAYIDAGVSLPDRVQNNISLNSATQSDSVVSGSFSPKNLTGSNLDISYRDDLDKADVDQNNEGERHDDGKDKDGSGKKDDHEDKDKDKDKHNEDDKDDGHKHDRDRDKDRDDREDKDKDDREDRDGKGGHKDDREDDDDDDHKPPKPTPTASPTPTGTPKPTPTATPTPTPEANGGTPEEETPPSATPTPTPAATPTPTATPKPSTRLMIGKFNDLNGNGKYDPKEPGIQAWFKVDQRDGAHDFRIQTDMLGNAETPVIAGQYEVCEEDPSGWEVTTPGLKEKPNCQVVIIGQGETKGVLFGNRPIQLTDAPMPPVTGLSRGDSFEADRPLSVREIAPKDRIVRVEITRGEAVVTGGEVKVANFGPTRVMAKGVMHEIETWDVDLQGRFSQLVGGGLDNSTSKNQVEIAIHDEINTGANPIGEVIEATRLKNTQIGDKLVKTMADGKVVIQTVKFAGNGDPREFYNPQKDSTIFITCNDESDVDNADRFVVYAETDEILKNSAENIVSGLTTIDRIKINRIKEQINYLVLSRPKSEDVKTATATSNIPEPSFAFAAAMYALNESRKSKMHNQGIFDSKYPWDEEDEDEFSGELAL